MKTLKELIKNEAVLLDSFKEYGIYEIYPKCYLVKEEKVIHVFDSLPKYEVKK